MMMNPQRVFQLKVVAILESTNFIETKPLA